MIAVPSGVRVWLAVGRTDMRRGMNPERQDRVQMNADFARQKFGVGTATH